MQVQNIQNLLLKATTQREASQVLWDLQKQTDLKLTDSFIDSIEKKILSFSSNQIPEYSTIQKLHTFFKYPASVVMSQQIRNWIEGQLAKEQMHKDVFKQRFQLAQRTFTYYTFANMLNPSEIYKNQSINTVFKEMLFKVPEHMKGLSESDYKLNRMQQLDLLNGMAYCQQKFDIQTWQTLINRLLNYLEQREEKPNEKTQYLLTLDLQRIFQHIAIKQKSDFEKLQECHQRFFEFTKKNNIDTEKWQIEQQSQRQQNKKGEFFENILIEYLNNMNFPFTQGLLVEKLFNVNFFLPKHNAVIEINGKNSFMNVTPLCRQELAPFLEKNQKSAEDQKNPKDPEKQEQEGQVFWLKGNKKFKLDMLKALGFKVITFNYREITRGQKQIPKVLDLILNNSASQPLQLQIQFNLSNQKWNL